MIADVVSAIGDLAYQFRISPGEASHQEKCCGRMVPFQQLQEFWRERRVWPVIEGERDLIGIRSVVQGAAKKLGGCSDGCPRRYSCPRFHTRGDEGPCI